MSKEQDRAALAALMTASAKPVTKVEAKPMDVALSASFKAIGIDKKGQKVKKAKMTSGVARPEARRNKRNWAAQRRYDAQHGTVNGYDERLEDALAMHNHEMGE